MRPGKWSARWPIRSTGRCSIQDGGRVVAGYGILQPRVGVSLPSARRSWFVRLFARRSRRGSLHARRVGRLSGPVRRRVVHRQGHLRRGRLRAVLRQFSRERHPEPRPSGKCLCPLGPAERRGAVRGISLALPGRRQPAASLDSRRLADCRVVAALGARGWQCRPATPSRQRRCRQVRANPISALSWWKIFDNLRRSLVPVAMLLLLLGAWLVGDPGVGISVTLFVLAVVGVVPLLGVLGDWFASRPICRCCASAQHGGLGNRSLRFCLRSSSSRMKPTSASMRLGGRWCACCGRKSGAGVEDLQRRQAQRAARSARLLPVDVDRPGLGRGVSVLAAYRPAFWPVAGPLLGLWLVSPVVAWWLEPAAWGRPGPAVGRAAAFPGQTCPANLAVLRGLCHGGRELAAAGQFSGTAGPGHCLAHQSDQHRHGAAGEPGRLRLRLLPRPASCSTARGRPWARWRGWSAIAATSSTGTTRARSSPLLPQYVSTVDSGNLVGDLLVLRTGLLELIEAKVSSAANLRRAADDAARGPGRGSGRDAKR